MDSYIVIPSLLVFFAICFIHAYKYKMSEWFVDPITYLIFNLFLQGPFEFIYEYTDYFTGVTYPLEYRVKALYMITLFALVAYVVYGALRYYLSLRYGKIKPYTEWQHSTDYYNNSLLFIFLSLVIYIIASVYLYETNGFQRLYKYSTISPLTSIGLLLTQGQLLIMAFAMLLWIGTKKIRYLVLVIFILLCVVMQGFSAGSRGSLLTVAYCILILTTVTALNARKVVSVAVLMCLLCVIMTMISSMRNGAIYANQQNTIYELTSIASNSEIGYGSEESTMLTASMIDRMIYHGNTLALLMQIKDTDSSFPPNSIKWGSISDLLSIIPRFVWHNKPAVSFQYSVGYYLFSANVMFPVGPAGEAFIICGWFGLFLAAVRSIIIVIAFEFMFLRTDNPILKAIYFFLLVMYFINGISALFNSVDATIKTLVFYAPIFVIAFGMFPREHSHRIVTNYGKIIKSPRINQ